MTCRSTLKFIDGSIYEGDVLENRLEGQGTYRWPDGRQFNGKWRNSAVHGRSEYTNQNIKFEGNYP